jgi:hypothetical protein
MAWNGSAVFTLVTACVFLLMIIGARNFTGAAWVYPIVIGVPLFILTLVQLVRELKGGQKKNDKIYDIAPDESTSPRVVYKKAAKFLGWMLGLYLGIWLVGFKLAFFLFFVSFVRFDGRRSWLIALSFSALTVLVAIFFYGKIFGVHWPKGQLETYITLPF